MECSNNQAQLHTHISVPYWSPDVWLGLELLRDIQFRCLPNWKWAWQPQIFGCASHASGWTPLSKFLNLSLLRVNLPKWNSVCHCLWCTSASERRKMLTSLSVLSKFLKFHQQEMVTMCGYKVCSAQPEHETNSSYCSKLLFYYLEFVWHFNMYSWVRLCWESENQLEFGWGL